MATVTPNCEPSVKLVLKQGTICFVLTLVAFILTKLKKQSNATCYKLNFGIE